MSYNLVKILWIGQSASESVEIVDWNKLTVKKNLDGKGNGLDLVFNVKHGSSDVNIDASTGELRYKVDDVIKVYAKKTDDPSATLDLSSDSSDLLMIADVVKRKFQSKSRKWTVSADDKTNVFLNRVLAKNFTESEGKDAPTIIKEVINIVTKGDVSAEFDTDGGFIQTTRPNGDSDFPIQTKALVWKPIRQWIEELSGPESLNSETEISNNNYVVDRPYRFYVDEQNRFHWFYPNSSSVDYDFNNDLVVFKSGSEIPTNVTSADLGQSNTSNINFVIFKSGEDLNGIGILWKYYDTTTENKKLKSVFRPYTDIAERAKRQMALDGTIKYDESLKNYDYLDSYPVGGVVPFWTTTSYDNDGDLNDAFREYCKTEGVRRAQLLTSRRSNPLWKGNITFEGYNFSSGELIQYQDVDLGTPLINVRIQSVTHQFTKSEWSSIVDVSEDDKSLASSGA